LQGLFEGEYGFEEVRVCPGKWQRSLLRYVGALRLGDT
jgi:hypothetical protein